RNQYAVESHGRLAAELDGRERGDFGAAPLAANGGNRGGKQRVFRQARASGRFAHHRVEGVEGVFFFHGSVSRRVRGESADGRAREMQRSHVYFRGGGPE